MESCKDAALLVCGLVLHFLGTDDVGFIVKDQAVIAAERQYGPETFIFADDTDLDGYEVINVGVSNSGEVKSYQ